jgi:DNA-binding NtrC family response regulator
LRDNAAMPSLIPARVLVIDDDESVCRKVAGWLREAACDVVTFSDPQAGLAHAARAPAPLAVVDLQLADTDGATVIATLRRTAPAMRIIAMCAFPDVPQVVAAMRAGALDLLEKPVQRESLLAATERQLADVGLALRSEPDFNRRLGARIRAVRTHAQRTLNEVAADCGLTAAQLSQIELGKTATTTWSLARISGALGLPLDRLLTGL